MSKPVSDKIETDTLEPFVINPTTVNNYKDNSILAKNEIEVGENIILDDAIIEKVLGTTKQSSDVPGGAVTGLHRAYSKAGDKVCLRLANGVLKSGPAAFATTVLAGLSTTKKTPFINIRGKAYGVNEVDGLIRYDPKTGVGVKSAIVSPELRKKIAFFESDETWTGGTADTGSYRSEEWSGNSFTSRKLTAAASGNSNSYSSIALDLSVFDNSKASDDNDLITFYTKHGIRANVDHFTVEFSTGDATFAVKFLVNLYKTDLEIGDYEWTLWDVKKGAFIATGAADWSTVKAVRFTLYAASTGTATMSFDMLYLAASPIEGRDLRVDIFSCENNTGETWTTNAVLDNDIVYEGNRAVYVAGTGGGAARTATLSLGSAIDLTKWAAGALTADSDELVFHVYCNDISAWTDVNCLTLRIGADSSNYFYYTWATKAALGMVGSNQWFEIRVKKGDVDALSVGSPNYNNIAYVAFVTSVLTGVTKNVYFDEMYLSKNRNTRLLAGMEENETWTFSNVSESGFNKYPPGVTQGASCITMVNRTFVAADATAQTVFSPVKDLTLFDDGSVSTTDDSISFDLLMHRPQQTIEYCEIWLDNNSGSSFANAYKHRFVKLDFTENFVADGFTYFKGTLIAKKSAFDQIGAAGGWTTIGAVKFIFHMASSLVYVAVAYIDNLVMKRRVRSPGTFYYKYCFMIQDIASALSGISVAVDNQGNDTLLTNVKTSQDSRVTARKIYRLGGKFPDTWMLVKSIEDNTTVVIIDDMEDDDLVLSLGDDTPVGFINGLFGNNLVYEPQSDRLLVWGDPLHKNFVWISKPGYYLVFDADGYREFSDEVMSVVPWYNGDVIFFRSRIQEMAGGMVDGALSDQPINIGACSYWAVKPLKNMIPFVGWDNVYVYNASGVTPIGQEIKGYFKGREAYSSDVVMGFCKDSIYIACKDKTGTPTYNNIVLRFYILGPSWTILPNWNVSMWANFDQFGDTNDLYYGDSNAGDIYSLNSATYRFGANAITSNIETGWLMLPDHEIAIERIELKAKGTASSTITFSGYKNGSGTLICSGTITLTTAWQTFTIGPKNIHNLLRGDSLKIKLSHSTDNAYFKMKDIVVYWEKIPKRITLNEVTVT